MEARLGLNHVLSAARKTACSTEFGSAQRCYVVWGMCRQPGRPMWTKLRFGAEAFPRFLKLIPVSTAGLIFATDGSGGPLSKEPRLQQVGFGVVALAAVGPHSVVGTLVGTIPGRQTVPRAEAFAFLKLLEMIEGPVLGLPPKRWSWKNT